jgi:hypothetical protein
LGLFCGRLIRRAVTPPYEIGKMIRQCDSIGSKSLPLVALAGAATGVVLSLEVRDSLARFGAKSLLPAVVIYSIVKESGPVITGLIMSGRVGAGIGISGDHRQARPRNDRAALLDSTISGCGWRHPRPYRNLSSRRSRRHALPLAKNPASRGSVFPSVPRSPR